MDPEYVTLSASVARSCVPLSAMAPEAPVNLPVPPVMSVVPPVRWGDVVDDLEGAVVSARHGVTVVGDDREHTTGARSAATWRLGGLRQLDRM